MLPWISRVILIVLDGAGVGALPDAEAYGDAGSNTLGHVAEAAALRIPTLQRLGLGNIVGMSSIPAAREPLGACGRLAQRSAGKDSTIGHWELAGVISPAPFPTYPDGFPPDTIAGFVARTGRGVLGNKPASGTEIIEELYEEHRATGSWIVYTSADSVFQVAAHEQVIPPEELYEACEVAAEWLTSERRVLRVIARPFSGEQGALRRTAGRRDWNMAPPGTTVLDLVSDAQSPVVTIGKVDSLFAGRGIAEAIRTSGNVESLEALRDEIELSRDGLMIANLIDFDMLYGHRNDVLGYAAALEEFDRALAGLLALLHRRDVLIISADHGCDPTTPSTDHSREYAPVIVYGELVRPGIDLGTRESFSDVGATICEALGLALPAAGRSFWGDIAATVRVGAESVEYAGLAWYRRRDLLGGSIG